MHEGCKKVQQDLARPGMLERFMEGPSGSDQEGTSAADCAAMRTSFAGLWSLDDLRVSWSPWPCTPLRVPETCHVALHAALGAAYACR
eukprot:1157916-Pelagomonas_calceolata.AAC.6